ncbi:hypothetical protein CK203_026751 [Vitis vinifera]|uniref:RNase H type-1 domain-containing protein n=1 Tax=Vitis vinifera TaxID=29760 RepID=A0A438IP39_VITVI|nr:hypothetical protein CK203_026751 [Vitis vinifera]
MKGQVMADFVLEYSRRPSQQDESVKKEWWTLRVDGASRSSGSGVGLLLQSPTGEHLEQAIRLGFSASNNEAEYEAILSGLDLALALSVSKLRIFSDSQLVVKHVQEEYEAKDARMAQYLAKVRNTLQQFTEWTIEKIKRADNRRADALAGIAASFPIKEAILLPIHVQTDPSVSEVSTCNTIEAPQAERSRMDDTQKPNMCWLSYMREYAEIIRGGRSLAHRAHSQGYYWPTMKKDATAYVKKCDKCQRYAPIPHMPSTTLKSISGPWPFAQWGMDIVGPLPATPAQKKFLLVATDYFSKWVEVEAYASIKDKDVTKFVEELPGVLWAYRTTPGRPTGNTPFALAYGMDAVIPTEIGLPTIRTDAVKQSDASMELGRNLDWTDEVREKCGHPDGRLSTKGISTLQSQSEAKSLQKWYASP